MAFARTVLNFMRLLTLVLERKHNPCNDDYMNLLGMCSSVERKCRLFIYGFPDARTCHDLESNCDLL